MKIAEVHLQPDWVLSIIAEDGCVGLFDITPYLEYEAFEELRDHQEFMNVSDGGYFIEWECGADLSADRAKSIFLTASAYSKAAKHINAAVSYDPSLLLPSQIIAALALELYFKSLYFIVKKMDFKINSRHSHDFNALFKELPEDLRKKLENSFHELMTDRDMKDVHAIEAASEVKIPLDLAGNLTSWSDVFMKVRYIYDRTTAGKSMMFFPEFEQAVTNIIFGIRPELQS